MKKLMILTVLLLALLALTANAESKIKFGVKAGLGMANLSGDGWDVASEGIGTEIDNKFKMGFGVGVMVQIPLGEGGLLLQPEAMYVMKGAKLEFPEAEAEGFDITAKAKIDYIEVPILVKYAFPTEGNIAPSIFAGPAVAFNIGSKFESEGADADELESGDIYNQKSIDFGIMFGGGLEFKVGEKSKLAIDLRYTMGLTTAYDDVSLNEDVPDDELILTDDDGAALELKNSNIQVTVGLLF